MSERSLCNAFALTLAACSGMPAHAPTDASASATDAGANDASPSDDSKPSLPHAVKALGYYTGEQASYDAITSFYSFLNLVSVDLYDVQTDGSIVGSDDKNVVAHDKSLGIKSFASISNFNGSINDFDPALGHAALVTQKDTVIANLVKLAGMGFDGINIDFEGLAYSANIADDRAAYTAFIHDLSVKLHAVGSQLIISVPGKTMDATSDTWAYPYDFAALAPDIDYMQLMTYDETDGSSAPGPGAGVDWVEGCVAYAASLVIPSKILIGLPAYGYDWDLTASSPSKNMYTSTAVQWKDTAAILATAGAATHWDNKSASPYVDYTSSDGHKHEAWYENPQSIQAKTRLVTKYALGGLSMWALGEEDVSFWQAAYAGL